jgi:hypothetical protein
MACQHDGRAAQLLFQITAMLRSKFAPAFERDGGHFISRAAHGGKRGRDDGVAAIAQQLCNRIKTPATMPRPVDEDETCH